MVVGGKRGEAYTRVGRPFFSPDGKQIAYVAYRGTSAFAVIGGAEGEEFRGIRTPYNVIGPDGTPSIGKQDNFEWAPDGHAVAYLGTSSLGIHVVIGDKKSPPYRNVTQFAWSPDGRRLAFAAEAGQDSFVVVDDRKGEVFDDVRDLVFSPDGARLAYVAKEGPRSMVVVGTEKEPPFFAVGRPVFSPDGKTVVHVIGHTTDGKNASGSDSITVNGVVDPRYGSGSSPGMSVSFGNPVFSPDGRRLAYKAISGSGQWMVIDGKMEMPGFDQVGNPFFSADGTKLAYVAMKGSKQLVVAGDHVGEKFSQVNHLAFSPDGTSIAYRAERFGKQVIVAGGATSDEFDEVCEGPFYSPDSKQVAFVIRQGKEFWSKVLKVR
jgi:Tol biopolymer transport system component